MLQKYWYRQHTGNTDQTEICGEMDSAFRNIGINGAMRIDQRNAGLPVAASNGTFVADRWHFSGADANTFETQQNPTSISPPKGFESHLGLIVKHARTLNAGDWFNIVQIIEADRLAYTGFGTPKAHALTLSFWVRSSIIGLHSGGLANANSTRSLPFVFEIATANTWEHKAVCIPGDTMGDWNTEGCGKGMALVFNLAAMPPNLAPAGSWIDGNHICAEGAVSVAGTAGATFCLTGVQLEVGTKASAFETLAHDDELALCRRYFERLGESRELTAIGDSFSSGDSTILANIPFRAEKRSAPTVDLQDDGNFAFVTKGNTLHVSTLSVIGAGPTALILAGKSEGASGGLNGQLHVSGLSGINLSSEL
jgi:hypothetical protein